MNLLAGRSLAEAVMGDVCTITRPSEPTFDAGTGDYTSLAETVYAGKVRIAPPVLVQPEVAGGEIERHDAVAWIPQDAPTVARGDVLTVTDSADAGVLGAYTVVGVEAHSHSVRRVLRLERA